jgi:hypothetical protein
LLWILSLGGIAARHVDVGPMRDSACVVYPPCDLLLRREDA